MINQSKTLLSFLVPSLPLRIEEYQREVGSEPEQDPSEPSEAQKPLHVSYFLFVEKEKTGRCVSANKRSKQRKKNVD